jgi:hypothetical protein
MENRQADDQKSAEEGPWPVGWQDHEQAQLRRLAKQPLWMKLLWLQEANRIARHMQRQRPDRRSGEKKE